MAQQLTMHEKGGKGDRFVVDGLPNNLDAEIVIDGSEWEIDGSFIKTDKRFNSPQEALKFVQEEYRRNL